ncbi:hypothetical protein Mapa_008521 [Marchantia paleacea]|nr:hypothetical protein Mapa_008521 [Marchantia paleacea]
METSANYSSIDFNTLMTSAVLGQASSTSSFATSGEAAIAFLVLAITSLLIWRFSGGEKVPPGSLRRLPFMADMSYLTAYYNGTTKAWYEEKEKKYGPIFKSTIMGRTMVFMDAPAGTKLILNSGSDEKLLKGFWPRSLSMLLGENTTLTKSGEQYAAHRSHLLKTFLGLDVMHKYINVMNRKAQKHIEEHWMVKEDDSVVQAFHMMHLYTFDLIAELCLGLTDPADLEQARHDFTTLGLGMFMTPIKLPGFKFYESWMARKRILSLLLPHIAKRRVELKEGRATADQDLLSALLSQPLSDGRLLNDAEIPDRLIHMVFAGHETSSSTMSTVLKNLGEHPEVYEKVVKEHAAIAARKTEGGHLTVEDVMSMTYSWKVVEESMRLTSPVPAIYREANSNFKYKDFMIHKGDVLVASAANSSWNESLFKDWQKFDPSRFEEKVSGDGGHYRFFPFGGGHRLCPGKQFARMNMMTFLHHLVQNIKWTTTIPAEKIFYDFLPSYQDGMPIKINKVKAF